MINDQKPPYINVYIILSEVLHRSVTTSTVHCTVRRPDLEDDIGKQVDVWLTFELVVFPRYIDTVICCSFFLIKETVNCIRTGEYVTTVSLHWPSVHVEDLYDLLYGFMFITLDCNRVLHIQWCDSSLQ